VTPLRVNTGLVGPIIITALGRARAAASAQRRRPRVVTLFMIIDENKSWSLENNITNTSGKGRVST
jgi:hypothetical protein